MISPPPIPYDRQHHYEQSPDMLNVHWDVNTICQYNCSYCYARREYGERWGEIGNRRIIDGVLSALERSVLPFNLGLLGGEPTLSQHYYYILDRLHASERFNRVYITTNAARDLTAHPHYPKMAFLLSYHPADIVDRELFFRNAKFLQDNGYKLKVNVMLHHDSRYWDNIRDTFYRFRDLGIRTHPHFIYGKSVHTLFHYRKKFWDYFEFLREWPAELCYWNDGQMSMKNDYEIFNGGLTNFQGWQCWNNNYEVDVWGRVIKFCLNQEKTSLLENPDFFRNIGATVAMKCPHPSCNCDGLLKQLKIRESVSEIE